MGKTALIVGVTGLIGKELLQNLLNSSHYKQVIAIARRNLNTNHPKLKEVITDLEHLHQFKSYFQVDDVFCCLGTTIKNAKTKEVMKRIDVDYPILVAKLSKEMGASHFLVVSSMGANKKSSIFYSKIKGILEDELQNIGYSSLSIFRPSLLLGKRDEFRIGESVGGTLLPVLSFLYIGPLRKYKPIEGKTVALGMYNAALTAHKGTSVYLSNQIEELAKRPSSH